MVFWIQWKKALFFQENHSGVLTAGAVNVCLHAACQGMNLGRETLLTARDCHTGVEMLVTRIAVADEYQIVLTALVDYLSVCGGFILCHQSDSSEKLFENLKNDLCEVIVTDFYLGDSNGPEGLQLIDGLRKNWPSAKIVLFTAMSNPSVLRRVVRMGVQAIVSKRDSVAELREALNYRRRLQGPYLSSSVQYITADSGGAQDGLRDAALTRREVEVLRFVGEGVRLVHIASRLGVSVSTIATHKANIMRKLGVESDLVLAQYAQQCGIADQRSPCRI